MNLPFALVFFCHPTDWLVLHDQFVLGRYRNAIQRDEEAGNGEDATRARPLHVIIDSRLEHQQLGADDVLRRDRQIHCPPVSTPEAPFD